MTNNISKEEQIGYNKGALATLAKERQELLRILTIVEQLMQAHISELKGLGVDLSQEVEKAKNEKNQANRRSNMKYTFSASGHSNITSMHRNTFEITKENFVTPKGDCIIGINADYDLAKLKNFKGKVKMEIASGENMQTVHFEVNENYNNELELVVRTTDFNSDRTFGINCDTPSKDFNRELIKSIKENGSITITISED